MTSSNIRRVLIVEDDPVAREHFRRAVGHVPELSVLAAVGSIRHARTYLVGAPKPQIILTDLGLPDGHGVELIRACRVSCPDALILVITVFGEESVVIESVLAGASGYLLKDGASVQIADAIRELLDGGSPLSPAVARYVLRMVQAGSSGTRRDPPPVRRGHEVPALTKREIEILEVIGRGYSCAEAAELLKLSVHTVNTHTRSIHRKLQVNSRSEAIFEAVARGLIRLGRDDG